jgi:3-dehydroquinate dehydratase II
MDRAARRAINARFRSWKGARAVAIDASVLVLNGPNLNMLGVREPQIYGSMTLDDLEAACHERAEQAGLTIDFRQSNHEGELVTWIQQARTEHDGIVINAGAYTHTSVAIMDALILSELPVIEVHLSNIFKREPIRHHSYISPVAKGMICGFGPHGYLLALDAIANIIDRD